jgi:hypothetical protein
MGIIALECYSYRRLIYANYWRLELENELPNLKVEILALTSVVYSGPTTQTLDYVIESISDFMTGKVK